MAAALLLSACGGDDGVSEEDFLAQMDAVCAEDLKRVNDAFAQEDATPSSTKDFARVLPQRVASYQTALDELKAIEPPENLAERYDSLIASQETVAEAYATALEAAKTGDRAAFLAANEDIGAAQQGSFEIASELGLDACANQLPAEDEADLRAVSTDIWTNADPAHCTEDYTAAFVEKLGGKQECVKDESDPSRQADSVQLTDITGVSGVVAQTSITLHGGVEDGDSYAQVFEYQDGRWKLNQVIPLN